MSRSGDDATWRALKASARIGERKDRGYGQPVPVRRVNTSSTTGMTVSYRAMACSPGVKAGRATMKHEVLQLRVRAPAAVSQTVAVVVRAPTRWGGTFRLPGGVRLRCWDHKVGKGGQLITLSRSNGRSLSLEAAQAAFKPFALATRVATGERAQWPTLAGFDGEGRLTALHSGSVYAPPPIRVGFTWIGHDDSVNATWTALQLAERNAGRWADLDAMTGIQGASDFLVRAATNADLVYAGRDLTIALERLVKVFHGLPQGGLRQRILEFQRAIGLEAVMSKEDAEAFVNLRNQLNHVGDMDLWRTHPGDPALAGWGAEFLAIGWLKTYVLRHFLAVLGYSGPVRDFGIVGAPMRPLHSRRFADLKNRPLGLHDQRLRHLDRAAGTDPDE